MLTWLTWLDFIKLDPDLKKYKDYIFDVGANDGTDGLAIALNNKEFFVHAFEANPYLVKKISILKRKIEIRKGIKIKNYKIHSCAVSDKKRNAIFNISVNNSVTSLNKLSKNLDKSWPGYKNCIFKVEKKIKVKVIKSDDFINKNKIKRIRYLRIDTQGNDLNVLKGLNTHINKVKEGSPHIVDSLLKKEINLVINTTKTQGSVRDSYSIRRTALMNNIPYYTTIAGAKVAVDSIENLKNHKLNVKSLQSIH